MKLKYQIVRYFTIYRNLNLEMNFLPKRIVANYTTIFIVSIKYKNRIRFMNYRKKRLM